MQWHLRDATEADRDFIFELHRVALGPYIEQLWGWDETWQRQHFDGLFERAGWKVLVAGGEAAGAMRTSETDRDVNLDDIEILPAFQRKGLGTSVIMSIVDAAAKSGRTVTLQVLRVNPAVELYKRLGFTIVAMDAERIHMRRDADFHAEPHAEP